MVDSVNPWGMKLGKVVFDEEDNRPKVTQNVAGIDVNEYIEGMKQAKLAYAKPLEDKIEKNSKTLEALETFKSKLTEIQSLAASMGHRINSTQPAQCIFDSKIITTSTQSSDAQFQATEGAALSSFTLKVNQLAKNDMRYFVIQAPDIATTPLGVTSTLTLGTSQPGSNHTFNITSGMTLTEIRDLINSESSTTKISAGLTQSSAGSPNNTYVLTLSASETGEPILIDNVVTGGTFNTPSLPSNYVAGLVTSTNEITALNQTGSITISSTSGTPQQFSITSGMSLTDIVNSINLQTGTTNVQASLIRTYTDPTGANDPVFQLKLTALNSNDTVTVGDPGDTGNIDIDLGLTKPVTDTDTLLAKVTANGIDYTRSKNYISGSSADTAVIPNINVTLTGASGSEIQGNIIHDQTGFFQLFNEFITKYNELIVFYNEQTELDSDTGKPKEGANLAFNNFVQKTMRDLKSMLANPVSGSSIPGLHYLGYDTTSDGTIQQPQDLSNFITALKDNYTGLEKLFSNMTSFSNPNFTIQNLPSGDSLKYVNKTITINLINTSDELSGTITIDGNDYNISVISGSATSGGILFEINDDLNASGLKGIQLYHGGSIPTDTSDSTTFSMTQGIMARIDSQLLKIFDTTLLDLGNKQSIQKGDYYQETNRIATIDKKNQTQISEIQKEATEIGKRLEREFDRVYQATIQLEQVMTMLDSFNQVNSK